MIENINEKRLKNLAIKIDIPGRRGWKKALSQRFNHKKQNVISTWINRGVPDDFRGMLEDIHIDPALWDEIIVNVCEEGDGEGTISSPAPSVSCPPDADMKLIGMAGIVLSSGTIYGQALKQNIEAFYQAVQKDKKTEEISLKIECGTG